MRAAAAFFLLALAAGLFGIERLTFDSTARGGVVFLLALWSIFLACLGIAVGLTYLEVRKLRRRRQK